MCAPNAQRLHTPRDAAEPLLTSQRCTKLHPVPGAASAACSRAGAVRSSAAIHGAAALRALPTAIPGTGAVLWHRVLPERLCVRLAFFAQVFLQGIQWRSAVRAVPCRPYLCTRGAGSQVSRGALPSGRTGPGMVGAPAKSHPSLLRSRAVGAEGRGDLREMGGFLPWKKGKTPPAPFVSPLSASLQIFYSFFSLLIQIVAKYRSSVAPQLLICNLFCA